MLLTQAPGLDLAPDGFEDRRAAGLALPVGAFRQALQRPVDSVEDGGGPGQLAS